MPRHVTISTDEVRHCAKCKHVGYDVYRHHKGCDGFLGWYNKGIAGKYDRYLDCVLLCQTCHCEIHFHYAMVYLRSWFNKTPRGASLMREKLIAYCDAWLEGKTKHMDVPERFRRSFAKSLKEWTRGKRT